MNKRPNLAFWRKMAEIKAHPVEPGEPYPPMKTVAERKARRNFYAQIYGDPPTE